jgi:hypothetical protein
MELKINNDQVSQYLENNLENLLTTEDISDLAAYIEHAVKMRTSKGKYLNKGAKTSYTRQYAAWKRQKGHPNTGRVNLFLSGKMLDAMTTTVTHKKGKSIITVGYIEGKSDEKKRTLASYHQYKGVAKAGKNIRKFIGLTASERKKAREIIALKISQK